MRWKQGRRIAEASGASRRVGPWASQAPEAAITFAIKLLGLCCATADLQSRPTVQIEQHREALLKEKRDGTITFRLGPLTRGAVPAIGSSQRRCITIKYTKPRPNTIVMMMAAVVTV